MNRLRTAPTLLRRGATYSPHSAQLARPARRVERILDISTGITGVIGAALIASNTEASFYGWTLCAVSSVFMIPLAWRKRIFGVMVMQMFFMVINTFGMYRSMPF